MTLAHTARTLSNPTPLPRQESLGARTWRGLPLLVVAALAFSGCFEGGLNLSESTAGNQVGGQLIGYDLAVSDDGRYVVTSPNPDSWTPDVWAVDLEALSAAGLPVEVGASRMVFATEHTGLFVNADWSGGVYGSTLQELDLGTGELLRTWSLGGGADRLTMAPEGTRLLAWGGFAVFESKGPGTQATPRWVVTEVDLVTGVATERRYDHRVVDARYVEATGDTAVVTDLGGAQTEVILTTTAGASRVIEVPNCASSLQISPDGTLGLLAPTDCHEDPVSVIDLDERRFVDNLPGFGPAAFSPDGAWALAFGRKADLAETAGIHTDTEYSLLFIDTATLEIEVLELGDDLPIFSITPDGEVVLIYSVWRTSSYDGIVLIDTDTRTLRETSGPEVDLTEFVTTPNGELVYLIDGGLFRLDTETAMISYVGLPCSGGAEPTRCNPDLVNILPDGETLVMGYFGLAEIVLFDIPGSQILQTIRIEVDGPGAAPRLAVN